MNRRADGLALCFGVGDAGELAEEQVGGVAMHQRDVVVVAEEVDHLLRLAAAQQAVIDEDAGELVADRLVDQHGGDRGVDAAGEAADHAALAHLVADPADRLRRNAAMVQSPAQPQMRLAKLRQQPGALGRVHDLRMELHAVEAALASSAMAAKGAPSLTATTRKPWRQRADAVAVAHPDLLALALVPDAVEQRAVVRRPRRRRGRTRDGRNAATSPPSWAHIVCSP